MKPHIREMLETAIRIETACRSENHGTKKSITALGKAVFRKPDPELSWETHSTGVILESRPVCCTVGSYSQEPPL